MAARRVRLAFSLTRTALALALLVLCLADWQAWWAWARYVALPDYNYAAHARRLDHDGRLAQARLVVQAGLDAHPGNARLRALNRHIRAEQVSWAYRAGAMVHGVLYGSGNNAWSLGAAFASDLFVFGDVRDLAIQGYHAALQEPVDPWVTGLSALGVVVTLAPEVDAGAALLKVARKSGSLSADMASGLVRLGRRAVTRGDARALEAVAVDAGTVRRSLGTRPALRLMKDLDSPAELSTAARFVRRYPAGGRFALWLYGGRGVRWLARSGTDESGALIAASRKGEAGLNWLRRGGALMLRPQPLIGVLKGVFKNNVPKLVLDALTRLRWTLLPIASLWVVFEGWFLRRRWRRLRAVA